ncbi:uncharacterized protein [Triticum aestivum]|uniref:uncharacterized protein n=1 Tax=Triticum aestivum TaxID=4565 RepID=UPI001D017CF2|nr:uncharacterized protein LOC123131818 [Triticum aestivum]
MVDAVRAPKGKAATRRIRSKPTAARRRTAAVRRRRWTVTSRHVLQIQLSSGTTRRARLVRQPPWMTQVQIVPAAHLLLPTAMFLLLLLPRMMALPSTPLQLACLLLRWPRRGSLAKRGGRRPSRFSLATPQSLSPSVSYLSPTSCSSGLNSVSTARR